MEAVRVKVLLLLWLTALLAQEADMSEQCQGCSAMIAGCKNCSDNISCDECCTGYYLNQKTTTTVTTTTSTTTTTAATTSTAGTTRLPATTKTTTTTTLKPTTSLSSGPSAYSSVYECVECSFMIPNCSSCTGKDDNVTCDSCTGGTFLYEGSCVTECPTNLVENTQSMVCTASGGTDIALIVGCAVGGTVLLVAGIIAIVCLCRKRKRKPSRPTPALPSVDELDKHRPGDTLRMEDSPSTLQSNGIVVEELVQGNGMPVGPRHPKGRRGQPEESYENPDDPENPLYVNKEDSLRLSQSGSEPYTGRGIQPSMEFPAPAPTPHKRSNTGQQSGKIPNYENTQKELEEFNKKKKLKKNSKDYENVKDAIEEFRNSRAPASSQKPKAMSSRTPPKGHGGAKSIHGYVNQSAAGSKYDQQVPLGGEDEDEYITKDPPPPYYNMVKSDRNISYNK